jgi:hypothetical protein
LVTLEKAENKKQRSRRFGGFIGGIIFGGLIMLSYFIKASLSEFYSADKLTLLLILLGCGSLGAVVGDEVVEKIGAWFSWLG